jgi:dienelactone hydrolase
MSKLALAVFSALLGLSWADAAEPAASPTPKRGELIEIPAEPAKGFHFPYLLFIPESPAEKRYDYLLVEPNNTGRTSDDFEVHRAAAIALARDSSVGNFVAKKLGVPLLVPVFPRASSTDDIYTHSLDRDTILITEGPVRRIDLQLLAMIADARPRLASMGRPVNSKVLMNGFSASGLFANRFVFLHPETVAAAAFGGVNCFIMLPVAELKSHSLSFPLGTADLEKITGHAFDRAAYQTIPQFAYMGAEDTNDAVVHDDAYSAEERALIFELLARPMPERWEAVQAVYANQKMPMQFKTYPGIGHGTNGKINNEVAEFFRGVIEKP